MNYILKDHLGSIQYVTDEQGNVVETLSFDPWGRRRNPVNWSYTGFPSSFLFDRGYTGHEHLDAFGLINMNGRMYDPVVSRFLSPAPITQASHNLQGLNRYSYLMNNPMNGTDPTGYMRKPNRGGGGGLITGGGPVFDYFEFVPSIFDQIDESVKRRSAKSALTYEELQELKKRDKEEADKAKQAKENANKKDDKSGKYNPDGKIFNFHFMGGMMNDGIQMDKEDGSAGGDDGSFAAAATLAGATLAPGWNVAFGEPTFWGEVAMGVATLAYGTYIYYNLPKGLSYDRPNNYNG